MADLRYVVLSDLHLGAGYSLLTHADADGNAQPDEPSPTLRGLAEGFRSLLPQLTGVGKPTLVLLGDVFDMSFATPGDVVGAFQRLVECFWEEPIFDDKILYVPGNHDHRQWRIMRDAALLNDIKSHHYTELAPELVITELSQRVVCEYATAIAKRATDNPHMIVESGYPNIGYAVGDNRVVMHHGHYIEGTYKLMSKLAEIMSGTPPSTDLREVELLNGPWIDFGWSGTGDQAQIGQQLFYYYMMMMDPAATHAMVQRMATKLIEMASGILPVRGSTVIDIHGFKASVQGIVEALLDLTVTRTAQSERRSVTTVLSDSGAEGIDRYLSGPVRHQLDSANWSNGVAAPHGGGRLNFIFGHTHKPFQDEFLVDGYTHPVQVWNTGGWVLDHPGLSPTQGGAAILVDEHANVASLRLFNDPLDGDVGKVRVEGSHSPTDHDNPLLASASAAVDPAAWENFSDACLSGLEERVHLLRTRYFDPNEHPPAVHRAKRSVR